MGIVYLHTNPELGSVGTSREIVITAAAQQIVATSGVVRMVVFNNSGNNITWGDSSVLADSGNVLFPSGSWIFENLGDAFSFYAVTLSTSGRLALNEYFSQ